MKHIKSHVIDTYSGRPDLMSIFVVHNPYSYNPLIDGLDMMILLVTEADKESDSAEHVRLEGERAIIRTLNRHELDFWITVGVNRNIIEWLVRGEIWLDRDGYLANVCERLKLFPESMRKKKQLIEFSGFLRTYLQAKQDLSDGNQLDAYSHILTALHHWAHIVLIVEGKHPELTVWKQLKRVHPGIYKLYEELTASPETLEQRVQLVILACEFSVMNNMKECCSILLDIMNSRQEPWSIGELQAHPAINELQVELSLVVQKLVKRAYIREVAVMQEHKDTSALELRYVVENA